MAASSARCTAPPRRGEGGDAPGWRPPGPCLLAAVLLLASWSDACVLPPPFEAMDPIDPKPYYKIGEKVEYKCKKGYNRLPFYLMVATCEKNHTWVPITDDACITGNEILYCELKEDKVQWSSSIPKCKNLLGPPPKITNGNYTFRDITMFQYFEAVTYSCNPTLGPDQLSLVGSEVLYCAAHETWSSAAPECKVIKCPSPVLKDGRQLSGFGKSFYYKAMVKFECMAGFYLNGSDTIMCGTENAWEPSIPQCIKGPRPTQPVKSPVYNYPGYPNPHEGLFDQELNVWISLLMLLVLVVAVAVLPLFVHRCVEHHNKSTKLTDDSHKEIKFTSL